MISSNKPSKIQKLIPYFDKFIITLKKIPYFDKFIVKFEIIIGFILKIIPYIYESLHIAYMQVFQLFPLPLANLYFEICAALIKIKYKYFTHILLLIFDVLQEL